MKTNQIFFSAALMIGLFVPSATWGNLLLGILPLILYFKTKGKNKDPKINHYHGGFRKFLVLLIIIFFISFLINFFILPSSVTDQSILRFFSLTIIFLVFPYVYNLEISLRVIYISFGIILLSQIAYAWNVSFLVNIFDELYPYTGDRLGYTTDFLISDSGTLQNVANKRYGGLYHNPNITMTYVTVLFAIFLIETRKKLLINKIPILILFFASVLLSGSRTSFIVFILLLLYDVFFYRKSKLSFKVLILFFLIVLGTTLYIQISDFGFRAFEVTAGTGNSLGAKFEYFGTYFLQLQSPIHFLIGHFSQADLYRLYGVYHMDSEWGMMLYNFGIIGFILYVAFYIKLISLGKKEVNLFLILLFWGITATILFSFRMSFVFTLVLSYYLNRSNKIKYHE